MSDSSSEDEPFIPPPPKRSARQRGKTEKMREGMQFLNEELLMDPTTGVIVQCSQTGRQHSAKIKDLSKDDAEPLTPEDLTNGASLIFTCDKKDYPVTFLKFKEKGSKAYKGEKTPGEGAGNTSAESLPKGGKSTKGGKLTKKGKGKTKLVEPGDQNIVDMLLLAKDTGMPTPRGNSTMLDNSDKDLIVNLSKQVQRMEKTLRQLVQSAPQNSSGQGASHTPVAEHAPETILSPMELQQLKLRRISAKEPYPYALQAMDVLFTKEEMGPSLIFKSPKSPKPALDKKRVTQLLGLLEKKFGDTWDIKTLALKANQKCRDSKKQPDENSAIKNEEASTSEASTSEASTSDANTNTSETKKSDEEKEEEVED